jgi:UPF0271 protein
MASDVRLAIDLNADLGEGCPWDELLLAKVTSASVCCGAHAGDEQSIGRTLRAAKANGVVVGAHPGYEDRQHFGRREQPFPGPSLEESLNHQLDLLSQVAGEEGVRLRFVKPHGALYNQAQRDRQIAEAIVNAVSRRSVALLGLPNSTLCELAAAAGIRYVAEGFIDRRYRPDGSLVARSEPNAILQDPAEIRAQMLRLVHQGTETLCIHGDNPDSVRLVTLAAEVLRDAGVATRSFA